MGSYTNPCNGDPVLFPYPDGAATGWLFTGLTNVRVSPAITVKYCHSRTVNSHLEEEATTAQAFVHPWSSLAVHAQSAETSRHWDSHIADKMPGHSWRPVAGRAAGAGRDSGTWFRQWQPAKRMAGQRTDGNERPCKAECGSCCRARSGWDRSRRSVQWRTQNPARADPDPNPQGVEDSGVPGPQKHQTDLFERWRWLSQARRGKMRMVGCGSGLAGRSGG